MNVRTQKILLHLTGCLAFLALPIIFSPDSLRLHNYWLNPPTQREFLAYLLVIAVFYLNLYWFIPRLYFQRRYLSFVLINLLCFLPVNFLPELVLSRYYIHPNSTEEHFGPNPAYPGPDGHYNPSANTGNHTAPPDANQQPSGSTGYSTPPPYPPNGPQLHPPFFLDLNRHIFVFLVVVFFALLLQIRERWERTEEEKVHAELSYLRAQINPHFLFNTLNSIYSLALEKSDKTPDAIVQLSNMMRYVLHETGKDLVPLEKEISYIRNYIELQENRFGNSIHLSVSISGNLDEKKIAPLILIPFIENAFKHGVNAEEDSDIRIHIEIREKDLQLEVANNKVTIETISAHQSGLGLNNTRQRLRLLYPTRHNLEIKDDKQHFSVFLTLNLI